MKFPSFTNKSERVFTSDAVLLHNSLRIYISRKSCDMVVISFTIIIYHRFFRNTTENADWLVKIVWDNRDDFFKIAEDEALDKRSKNHGSLKSLRENVEGCASVERNDQLRFYCLGTLSCNLIFNLFSSRYENDFEYISFLWDRKINSKNFQRGEIRFATSRNLWNCFPLWLCWRRMYERESSSRIYWLCA